MRNHIISWGGLAALLMSAWIGNDALADRYGLSEPQNPLAHSLNCEIPVAKVVLNYLAEDNKVFYEIKVYPTLFSSCVKTIFTGYVPEIYFPFPSTTCREEVTDAEPGSFMYLRDFPLVAKDKASVYISGHKDKDVDAETFQWLPEMKLFTDKNGTYAADRTYQAASDNEIVLMPIDNKGLARSSCDVLKTFSFQISLYKERGVNPSMPTPSVTLQHDGWVAIK